MKKRRKVKRESFIKTMKSLPRLSFLVDRNEENTILNSKDEVGENLGDPMQLIASRMRPFRTKACSG